VQRYLLCLSALIIDGLSAIPQRLKVANHGCLTMLLWYGRASGLTVFVLPGDAARINQKSSGSLKKNSLLFLQEKYRAGRGPTCHVC
jgi:hypothetical protein